MPLPKPLEIARASAAVRQPALTVHVKPGITDKELARIIETIGRERGCLACGLGGPLTIIPEIEDLAQVRVLPGVIRAFNPQPDPPGDGFNGGFAGGIR